MAMAIGTAISSPARRHQEEAADDAGAHERDPDQHREGPGCGAVPPEQADARDRAQRQEEREVEGVDRVARDAGLDEVGRQDAGRARRRDLAEPQQPEQGADPDKERRRGAPVQAVGRRLRPPRPPARPASTRLQRDRPKMAMWTAVSGFIATEKAKIA